MHTRRWLTWTAVAVLGVAAIVLALALGRPAPPQPAAPTEGTTGEPQPEPLPSPASAARGEAAEPAGGQVTVAPPTPPAPGETAQAGGEDVVAAPPTPPAPPASEKAEALRREHERVRADLVAAAAEGPRPPQPEARDAAAALAEATYTRTPLPEAQNAWTLWRDALADLERPQDEFVREDLRAASDLDEPMDPTWDWSELRDWIDSKKAALHAISRGIERGKLQFPEFHIGSDLGYLSGLRNAARLKTVRMRLHLQDDEPQRAADEALEIVCMGELVARGEGAIIHYLVGVAVQQMGLRAVRHVADADGLPEDALAGLVARLPAAPAGDAALAQTYRVEFTCFTLSGLENIRRGAVAGLNNTGPGPLQGEFAQFFDVADTGDEHGQGAKAFDYQATKELFALYFAQAIGQARGPWPQRQAVPGPDLKAIRQDSQQASAQAAALLKATELDPDDAQAMQARKNELQEIVDAHPNFMGKQLVALLAPATERTLMHSVKRRTLVDLTRAYLALRLYERRRGELPASLADLTDAGILDRAPMDLFTNEPVRYAPEARSVYSRGPQGEYVLDAPAGDPPHQVPLSFSSLAPASDADQHLLLTLPAGGQPQPPPLP